MVDIKVLVVDDQAVYRSALVGLLEVVGGYAVVAEAEDGVRAVELAADDVDLVLMDLRLPGLDGLTATRLIRAADRAPQVVLISTDVAALPAAAVATGALAAVAKADLDPDWLNALRATLTPPTSSR